MRINKFPRDDKLESIVAPKEKPITTTYKTQGVPNTLSEKEVGIVEKGIQAETEVAVEETWTPPTQASTIPNIQKELEKETTPQTDENVFTLPGEKRGDKTINADPELNRKTAEKLRAQGKDVRNADGTPYDFKPKATHKPVLSKPKLRTSDNYKTSYDSLLDQIETQKIIYAQPDQKVNLNVLGEVKKAELFNNTVEVNMTENPTLVVEKIIKEIKKELPKEIIVDSIPKEAMIEVKSTYKFTYNQNQILYSLREDLRPLYKKEDGSLTGARFTGKGDDRVENTIVRKSVSKKIRQAFWDTYIEEPTESGKTKATKNTLYSGTPIPANLLRTQRGVYWYGEYNPDPNY